MSPKAAPRRDAKETALKPAAADMSENVPSCLLRKSIIGCLKCASPARESTCGYTWPLTTNIESHPELSASNSAVPQPTYGRVGAARREDPVTSRKPLAPTLR